MTRRSLLALLSLCSMLVMSGAHAELVQGQDYRLLSPPRSIDADGKVTVIEFFSYGCPHCAHLHPSLTKWVAELPDDVQFIRVPVSFGRMQWGQLVRAFYALQEIGELDRLDQALFDAIHEERQPLFTEERLAAWVAEKGGDAAKFRAAFNSAEVSSRALQADQLSRDFRVSGVPQLVIDGKYVALGGTHGETLRIAGELIEKARAEQEKES